MGTGSFPVAKLPRLGVGHPPHIAPRLKEEQSCTSAPLWAFVASSKENFNFTFGLRRQVVGCIEINVTRVNVPGTRDGNGCEGVNVLTFIVSLQRKRI
jgi:hypothetical protein